MKFFDGGWHSRSRARKIRLTVCTFDDESNAKQANDSRMGTVFDETTYVLVFPYPQDRLRKRV